MGKSSWHILYVGPLGRGSTTLQRMRALQELGHTTKSFDVTAYYNIGSRLSRSLRHRTSCGRAVVRMNKDLIELAKDTPYDCVWIDKGIWVYPETIATLKRNTGAVVIHYTPDPAIVYHRTRHFMRSIPLYDILITTKSYEVQRYKENGARNVIFARQGYDRHIFRPQEVETRLRSQLESGVCFVGHYEEHYYRRILAVSKVAENIAVWGQWGRCAMRHPWLKRVHRGNGIWHVDYAKALCCARIGLGLLSKLVPDQTTTRSYEIAACGTFLLAERTEEHLEVFDEGKEAEFFGSDGELLDKVRYYLGHDEERKRIALAGRKRCVESGYSYDCRLKEVVDKIAALLR